MILEYQKELLNTENPGDYKYLDSYWQNLDRLPYYIVEDGVVVGFVLINRHSLFIKDAYNIAEFFIQKQYRKKGIGGDAVSKVFSKLNGNWEIRVLKENKKAQAFWRKTLNIILKDKFNEVKSEDKRWNGVVFTFVISTMYDH